MYGNISVDILSNRAGTVILLWNNLYIIPALYAKEISGKTFKKLLKQLIYSNRTVSQLQYFQTILF